ncbi:MAG TPA: hypothetical protein PLW44_15260 [Chitinophagales bacterium]|nr:hypothetical protein [Chitinophagales bacterium]
MGDSSSGKSVMTFWGYAHEHPKKTWASIVVIVLVIIWLIFFNKSHFKVGSLEINSHTDVSHDTVYIQKESSTGTQQGIVSLKDDVKIKPVARPEKNLSPTMIETATTSRSQPTNINTGVNNGIIGNNNAVNVNVSKVQRKLTEPNKKELLNLICQVVNKNNLKDTCVIIMAVTGDSEAFAFSNEILAFLKTVKNIKVEDYIGQFNGVPILKGVSVEMEHFLSDGKCVVINVGYK